MKFSVIHINNKGKIMGYRSDVGFSCTEGLHKVVNELAEVHQSFKQFLNDSEPRFHKDDEGRYLWLSCKFYDSFKEVAALQNLMSFFDDACLDDHYGFIRIGEELDDVEQKGNPYEFEMYVNRNIEI